MYEAIVRGCYKSRNKDRNRERICDSPGTDLGSVVPWVRERICGTPGRFVAPPGSETGSVAHPLGQKLEQWHPGSERGFVAPPESETNIEIQRQDHTE